MKYSPPSYGCFAAVYFLFFNCYEVVSMNPVWPSAVAAASMPKADGPNTVERSSPLDTANPSQQQDPPPHHQTRPRPVAIITGGSRGIGSGIAAVLARQGYDLILTYNTNKAAANEFKDSLQQEFPSCQISCVGGDLTLTETRDCIFARLLNDFPDSHLQVLVHNAGQYLGMTSENSEGLSANTVIFGNGSLLKKGNDGVERADLSAIDYYRRLYGDAWIDLCERSIERMKHGNTHRGGSIIGISSPGVNAALYKPDRTYSGPGCGKAVLEYSMRIYAKVAAEHNINVNVIIPGIVHTKAWEKAGVYRQSDEDVSEMLQRLVDRMIPMKRLLEPTDIGEVIAFLCSPAGKLITGVALPVDGGLHIN